MYLGMQIIRRCEQTGSMRDLWIIWARKSWPQTEVSCPWISKWDKKREEKTMKYAPLKWSWRRNTKVTRCTSITSSWKCLAGGRKRHRLASNIAGAGKKAKRARKKSGWRKVKNESKSPCDSSLNRPVPKPFKILACDWAQKNFT